jgi:glycerol-3-phosphate acyltransferase PlsY
MGASYLEWLWLVPFFLLGSIPTGYLIGRARGIDIRQHGSGNIGATNVYRVMGRGWGIFAFLIDFIKGFALLLLVRLYVFPNDTTWSTSLLLVLCGMAAILGHNYTPWLGFKGGKGVATTAGVLAALLPWALVVVFSLWIILTLLTRIVSIGSLTSAILLPFVSAYFYPGQWIYLGLSLLAGILVVWQHRSNIRRLLAGTEPRFGAAATKKATP